LLLAFLLLLGAAPATGPESFVLNLTSVYPEEHPLIRLVLRPWSNEILRQSNGRLIIRIFNPGEICPDDSLSHAVRLGQADMAYGSFGLEAERFPLFMVSYLDLGFPNPLAASQAFWRLFTELPEFEREFTGIHLLALHAETPSQFFMLGEGLCGIGALRDQRILTDNPWSGRLVTLAGGRTAFSQNTALPLALRSETLDGALLTFSQYAYSGLRGYFAQACLADLPGGALWLGMHQGLWESLPQDLRKILTDNSGGKLSLALGEAAYATWREAVDALEGTLPAQYLSEEERHNLRRLTQDALAEEWRERARKAGVSSPRGLLERVSRIAAEAAQRYTGN
jgi:TRAP-type C4-dicarboxylate transport system substrate-binding protein